MVVNQEEQEMPTEQEVLSVKPLAQLSPLKEVRQSLILKKKSKIHHRIGHDLQTPNHLIDSKMLVVMEFTIWHRKPFQSFCFIVYRVAVPALSESALRQNPFNQERRKR